MAATNMGKKDMNALAWVTFAGLFLLLLTSFDSSSPAGGIISSDFFRYMLMFSLVCSVAVGLVGYQRRIGFAGSFFLSLLASPVIGLIGTFLSPTLEDEAYKEKMLELTEQGNQATPFVADNKLDQLYKLNELRKEGVLTQEEFNAEKAKILAS